MLGAFSVFTLAVFLSSWQAGAERVQFTNSWAVEVKGGSEAADMLASKHGFINLGQVSILKDIYHFVMPEHTTFGRKSISGLPVYHLTQTLEQESNVGYVKQQVLKRMVKKSYSVPSDPQWNNQWQLLNTGQLSASDAGRDINVERVWLQGVTGCGSLVAIVDDGVEYTHPDLRDNYDSRYQLDILQNDNNPFPVIGPDGVRESHGTSCAGEIAMTKNNTHCGVGVAYNCQITGIRLLGNGQTDITEANALGHRLDNIHVSSNSWGPADDGRTVEGPGELLAQVLQSATREGRQGKGTIYLFAAGNGGDYGDNCAADGYATSIYTIGIGAVGSNGEQVSYDETCAGKLAVTLVDDPYQQDSTIARHVTTTGPDNTCINNFDGTSAATPMASGIIALVLEVNDALTWRDVQYLIVYTSNRDILVNGEWITNGANPSLRVSHKFGFGLLDAEAMVSRARNWINVPAQQTDTGAFTPDTGTISPTTSGQPANSLTATYTYSSLNIVSLEHVVLELSLSFPDVSYYYQYGDYDTIEDLAPGPYRGNIQVELTSPSGTTSLVLPYRNGDVTSDRYIQFPFLSVLHWGENPNGQWTVTVRNNNNFENASVNAVIHGITFYGTSSIPQAVSRIPSQCDSSCDSSRGCGAAGAEHCDGCANLRNAHTLECIDICPEGFVQRNNYCYNSTRPEVGCERANAGVVPKSVGALTLPLVLLAIWLGLN